MEELEGLGVLENLDMEVRLVKLEEWRDRTASPQLKDHGERIDQLESDRDNWKGSLRVIIWMNWVIISLVIGGLVALFAWGLTHVTVHLV